MFNVPPEFVFDAENKCLVGTSLKYFIYLLYLFLGLERKISVRTSKEELIERGILLPGEVGVWEGAPAPWEGTAPTPHYNTLPLPNNNSTGRFFYDRNDFF